MAKTINTKLLVVVDESPATKKALQYVAQIVGKRKDFRICLAHSVKDAPPELTELRGAEKKLIQDFKHQWIEAEEMTEQRAIKRANAILLEGGVTRGSVEAHYCYLVDGALATKEIVELAGTLKCGTIVIGRKSLSWLNEIIQGDPADELIRLGDGFTIWVVE
jgi:hypothetical protein